MNRTAAIPLDWRISLDLLQRLGCGGIVIDGTGRVIQRNGVATRLVGEWLGELPADVREIVNNLAQAPNMVDWLRRKRHAPLILHVMARPARADTQRTLLVLIDPRQPGTLDGGIVRSLFGLTEAESNLAVRLVRGERVQTIACARGVTLGTVRTQLRMIFSKTRTKSQASLVLLLARLASIQTTPENNGARL